MWLYVRMYSVLYVAFFDRYGPNVSNCSGGKTFGANVHPPVYGIAKSKGLVTSGKVCPLLRWHGETFMCYLCGISSDTQVVVKITHAPIDRLISGMSHCKIGTYQYLVVSVHASLVT